MTVRETWEWVRPKILPLIIGGVAGMAYIGSEFVPSSDVIASSPDRIIPAASRNSDGTLNMSEGALNTDLLEVKVCDADSDKEDKPGQESVFVYDGKKQVAILRPDGYIEGRPYEGKSWRCG